MAGSWSEEEALNLISVWGTDSVQAQLRTSKRNKYIFVKVALELSAMGYSRSADQCREKLKKMKGEYRKRKSSQEDGTVRKHWKFMDAMERVMGRETSTHEQGTTEDNPRLSPLPQLTLSMEGSDRAESVHNREPVLMNKSQQCMPSPSQADTDLTQNIGSSSRHKRRRECDLVTPLDSTPQLDSASCPATESHLLVKLIEIQHASERRQFEMEEKRMKFEERMMERDDQRRREDRQFQLQMMSVIMGRSPVQLSVPLEPHNNSISQDET